MYREIEWRDGWLMERSTPNGDWWPASERAVIMYLAAKVLDLEAQVAALRRAVQ